MAEVGHVARGLALALLLAGCAPAAPAPAGNPCPGTADGAIAALPLPPNQETGDFRHLLLTSAAKDFCPAVPEPDDTYFVLQDAQQRPRYTRRGAFQLVAEGNLQIVRHASGLDLSPELAVPGDARAFTVTPEGVLVVDGQELGLIFWARFPDPAALKALEGGLFEETAASGPAALGSGRLIGAPRFLQGRLYAP